MSLFIDVEVDPKIAKDTAIAKKLVEVCPVNIFKVANGTGLEIVEANLDECVLCELCLNAAPPKTVQVKKLYGKKEVLERKS